MSQSFIKTAVHPQIFVFAQQLVCNESELYFDEFVLNFECQYITQEERNWIAHWNRHGYELILEQWKLKYSDCLACNVEDKKNDQLLEFIEKESVDVEPVEDSSSNTSEELSEPSTSWKQLWEQHTEEIYTRQYSFFDSIFYNYFLEFKSSLQNNISSTYEFVDETQQAIDSVEPQDRCYELEQLHLLGLPTQFGARPQVYKGKKRHAEKNLDIWTLFSAYFSDNEDEDSEEDKYTANFETLTETPAMEAERDGNQQLHTLQALAITKAKKKTNRKLRNIPAYILEEKALLKYWRKRFSLFSRFDEGIRLDRESWFSVTPEKVAIHLAERLACDTLIDGFCGSGGNAIQFAKTCQHVIAIDIDPLKIEMAKHNAGVYGVAERIDFIVGDFFHFVERLRGDVVFLSPPWGGPKYKKKKDYDVEKFLLPVGASELVTHARHMTENVALFLPRNSNLQQIVKIAGIGKRCVVEHNYLDTRLIGITALYGEAILQTTKESVK